tara:strand:- start:19333 stop:19560 length:228 start_codon:yes stop_codon:yes gene_type:complete
MGDWNKHDDAVSVEHQAQLRELLQKKRDAYVLENAPQIAAGIFSRDVNASDSVAKRAVEIAGFIFDKVNGIKSSR